MHYEQVTQIVIDKVLVKYVNTVQVLCGNISECKSSDKFNNFEILHVNEVKPTPKSV